MKPLGAIAIFTKDKGVLEPAMAAALECGRGLHLASSAPEAFGKIERDLGGVDLFIVDVDAEVHGVALLNALSVFADRIPILVVTSLEQADMEPVARSKGAVACFGKPVTKEQLQESIVQWATQPPEPLPVAEVPWTLRSGATPGAKYGPGFRGPLIGESATNDKTFLR